MLIQDIKIALGLHLRSLGFKTGNPGSIYTCGLDVYIPSNERDYLGSVQFGESGITVVAPQPKHRQSYKEKQNPCEEWFHQHLDYAQPDLLDQLVAILAWLAYDLIKQHGWPEIADHPGLAALLTDVNPVMLETK